MSPVFMNYVHTHNNITSLPQRKYTDFNQIICAARQNISTCKQVYFFTIVLIMVWKKSSILYELFSNLLAYMILWKLKLICFMITFQLNIERQSIKQKNGGRQVIGFEKVTRKHFFFKYTFCKIITVATECCCRMIYHMLSCV